MANPHATTPDTPDTPVNVPMAEPIDDLRTQLGVVRANVQALTTITELMGQFEQTLADMAHRVDLLEQVLTEAGMLQIPRDDSYVPTAVPPSYGSF